MASEYSIVEKGTPNSQNYRVFLSEYDIISMLFLSSIHIQMKNEQRVMKSSRSICVR